MSVEEPHWEKLDTELMNVERIQIVDRIVHPTKARIDAMAKSLSGPLGQIEPILVTKHVAGLVKVVAGATRLLAAQQLGWKQIEATTIAADNDFEYQLIEIEENLGRHDLGAEERELLKAKRKEVQAQRLKHLEAMLTHPAYTDENGKPSNRKRNEPPVKAKGGRGKKGGVADAARKAGVSRSTAQRHIAKKAKPAQIEKRAGLADATNIKTGSTKSLSLPASANAAVSKVTDAIAIDVTGLSTTAQKKLGAALKKATRQLHDVYADRMRGVDEEIRLRVVENGKAYLDMLKAREVEIAEKEEYLKLAVRIERPPFTSDEFKTVLMCLHPDGERTTEKLSEAFRLFNAKKLQFTGAK